MTLVNIIGEQKLRVDHTKLKLRSMQKEETSKDCEKECLINVNLN